MAAFGEGSSQRTDLDDEVFEVLACDENCENGNTEWRSFLMVKFLEPVGCLSLYADPTCGDSNQIKISNELKPLDGDILRSYTQIVKEDRSLNRDILENFTQIGNQEKSLDRNILENYTQIENEDKSFCTGSPGFVDSNQIKVGNGSKSMYLDNNQIKVGNGKVGKGSKSFGRAYKVFFRSFIRSIYIKSLYKNISEGVSLYHSVFSYNNQRRIGDGGKSFGISCIPESGADVTVGDSNQSKIGNGGKTFGRAYTAESEGADVTGCDSNQIKMENREPIATLALTTHVRWVVLGFKIYCIGIDKSQKSKSSRERNWPRNYERDVYCFDISRPGQGWYPGPSMIAPRFFPYTLVLGGKLYVMGGVADIDFEVPWAEVFDPITGEWEALPDPPPSIQDSRLVYAASHDDGESKIVLGTYHNSVICEYNAANKSWKQLPGHDMKFEYSGPAVAFDGKLYWFTETGHLSAYDLRHKLLYKGLLDKRLKDIGRYSTLVHLGGDKFCLLWISGPTEPKSESDSDYEFESGSGRGSCFRCFRFEVSMGIKNGKGWLKASKHTCQSVFIDTDVHFMDAMLMGH